MNECLCYLLIVYYQILHKLSTLFSYVSYIFLLILYLFHKLYIQQYIVREVQTFAQFYAFPVDLRHENPVLKIEKSCCARQCPRCIPHPFDSSLFAYTVGTRLNAAAPDHKLNVFCNN